MQIDIDEDTYIEITEDHLVISGRTVPVPGGRLDLPPHSRVLIPLNDKTSAALKTLSKRVPPARRTPEYTKDQLRTLCPDLDHLEFDDGWCALMREAVLEFEELCKTEPSLAGGKIVGGKQKYAELVLYTRGVEGKFRPGPLRYFLDKYTEKSRETCEKCGAPGTWRPYSWEEVRCDECHDPSLEERF